MEATPALLQDAPAPTLEAGTASPRPGRSRRFHASTKAVLARVLVLLAWSLGCAYLLNTSTFVGRPDSGYISTNVVALAGIAVDGIWAAMIFLSVLMLFLGALTGRLWVGLALVLDLCLLLGAVNAVKLRVRAEPLSPSDLEFLSTPGFLADMVPTWTLVAAVGALLVVPMLVYAVFARRTPLRDVLGRPWSLLGRAVLVLACGAALLTAPGFNQSGNPWRTVFDADVNRWAHWSQHENFMVNGFVGGLLYDMPVEPMAAPPGYTKAHMDRIVAEYARAADQINADRVVGALDDVNVVVVLSESFSDPARLDGIGLDEDPIPETRGLMSTTTSGNLLIGGFGGGTANVEFEALTGLSQSFFAPQLSVPFQQLVDDQARFPSLVRWFSDQGHDTVAVHPFSGEMYKRSDVYPRLGFDEFVTGDDLLDDNREHVGEYVGDAELFDEVLDRLQQHEPPVLAHVVTMQNHFPYSDVYPDPVGVTDGADDAPGLGQYARGLQLSDAALADFVDELDAFEEPTVLVFFGDHLPGIYSSALTVANGDRAMRETPYLVWSNVGEEDAQAIPTASPNQLLPLVFDEVGATVPPYVALLEAVRGATPALQRGLFVDADDVTVRDEDELDPAARRVLEDYRLVQYDLAVGHRWSEAGLLGE